MMDLDKNSLVRLKAVELDLMRAFIECCDQLGLGYYLMGGSMLGAVRHQGFIPWDDDIDLGMIRADYDVFVAQAQSLLPEYYFVQSRETEPAVPSNFAKLRDSRTTFVEQSTRDVPMNHGVYIDIFPLDFYPEDPEEQARFDRLNKRLSLRIRSAFTLSPEQRHSTVAEAAAKVASGALSLRFGSVNDALDARDALYRSVPESGLIANYCGAWGKREIVPADWYGDGTAALFETIPVRLPAEYDKWLTQVYGDYMALPPEEQRKSHHYLANFDLDHPYTDYLC